MGKVSVVVKGPRRLPSRLRVSDSSKNCEDLMRVRPLLLLIPAATALLYACGGADTQLAPDTVDADIVLEGDVTGETFVAMKSAIDQGQPASSPTKSATIEKPADGASVPRAAAPTFTWHIGPQAGLAKEAQGQRLVGLDLAPKATSAAPWSLLPFSLERRATQDVGSALRPLRELFGPIRTASAHGDPFNGTGTLLVFATASDAKLVRVFTGVTTYTPTKEAWDKMTAAGKPITITLISAVFEQDRVVMNGGPFTGSISTFTVDP
jgi:hypothetical protein